MQVDKTARIKVLPTERVVVEAEEAATVRITPVEEESQETESLSGGKFFEQYTILSRIGNGGMGVVYLARDKRLGRFVAIKRLNSQAQSVPALRQRFLHEARAVAALSHVHIVHIYGLGEDEDGPFIAMEYVGGPDSTNVRYEGGAGEGQPNPPLTLEQYVTQKGQLTTEEAMELLIKISRAVAYAHSCRVIHRDLKPSNILMDKSGEPKIVDFGLARLMHKEEVKLTVPGEKLLSLGYGAPEQESDACLSDERSDVYGLGALLYFTITGQNPRYFREQDVPVQLREVVVKALETDMEQRWPTAMAFSEALFQVQNKTRVEVPTVKTTWRCKWCDAVNPLSIKFCAECGWDGSENCAECGAETFVGVQYCGNCGADARSYESVLHLLERAREELGHHRYEKAISAAGRVHGFEAAGPEGRGYLSEVAQIRERAERSIQRREMLKEQVEIEMRAENFERAEQFIREYRELSGERAAFEAELKQLPELTSVRDLLVARKSLQSGDYNKAFEICRRLLEGVSPDNREALEIIRRIRQRARIRSAALSGATVLVAIGLYMGLLPAVAKVGPEPPRGVVRGLSLPGVWFYENSLFKVPLGWYAGLWLSDGSMGSWYNPPVVSTVDTPPVEMPKPSELDHMQREYVRQVAESEAEEGEFQRAWPAEYLQELEQLIERQRTAGEFEAWEAANEERNNFKESHKIGSLSSEERSELNTLKSKYRQLLAEHSLRYSRRVVNLCKKYVHDLTDLRTALMQDGRMDLAETITAEIKRARGTPQQLAAEATVAAATASGLSESGETKGMLASTVEGQVQAVAEMRQEYEQEIKGGADLAQKQRNEWPERYLTGLQELMENFQRAGDYIGWESTRDEVVRFEIDRAITSRDIVFEPEGLMELQRSYYVERAAISRNRSIGVIDATDRYLEKLQELQRRLTVDGQMEAAAGVNSEIKRVRASSDYKEAQSEINPLPPQASAPTVDEVVEPKVKKPAETGDQGELQ